MENRNIVTIPYIGMDTILSDIFKDWPEWAREHIKFPLGSGGGPSLDLLLVRDGMPIKTLKAGDVVYRSATGNVCRLRQRKTIGRGAKYEDDSNID